MPDVLPFLNEREVLTFKWTANTPRSSLRQPSKAAEELLQQVNSSGSSSSGSYDRIARGVRWDASVLSKDDKTNKKTDNFSSSIGSARQYRYSATARAEHSRRVLNEQEQERKKAAIEASEVKDSSNDDPFKLDKASADKEADTSPQTAQHDHSEANTTGLEQTNKNVDVTSPFSGNRQHSDEEQINSSPIASPTRNIRSAQKSNKEWMVPLGSDKSEEGTPKQEKTIVQSDEGKEDDNKTAAATNNKENEQPQNKEEPTQNNSTQIPELSNNLSLQKKSRIHDSYQRMVSIVDALRGHPSNRFFRQSIEYDDTYIQFVHFLRQHNRPVLDFHILAKKLNEQRYGEENIYAAFASDLTEMWCNIRGFFGPSSPQGQCADFLEKFSRIIMVEWRREGGKNEGKGKISPPSKDAQPSSDGKTKAEAMARAAKMLHNMTYGNTAKSHPPMPTLKRKASDSKASESNNRARFNAINTRPTFAGQEKKDISPKRLITSSTSQQKSNGTSKAPENVYNPNTQAFLASLFPKGNHGQPASANKESVPKSTQHSTPEQRVVQNTVLRRVSTSPKDARTRGSPKSKTSVANVSLSPIALKRTEPPSSNQDVEDRPAKRAHIEISSPVSSRKLPILTVSDEDPAVIVPQSSLTKSSTLVKSVPSPSKDEEIAIEQALTTVDQKKTKEVGKRTPPSSARKSAKEVTPVRVSPRHNKVEAIKNSEPRRTSRQSTPTRKAQNTNGQSPSRSSPDKTPQKEVQTEPKRMATRKTPTPTTPSASTRASTRQRRVTAAN